MSKKSMIIVPGLLVLGGLILTLTVREKEVNAQDKGAQAQAVLASKNSGKSCAGGACSTLSWKQGKDDSYSEVERKLISHFSDRIAASGLVQFEIDEVSQATGIAVDVLEGIPLGKLQPAIVAELKRRNVDLQSLSGQSCGNCSRFSACSVDRDLSGATGEELLRYEKEKAQDGAIMHFTAPAFTVPTTDRQMVSLSQYQGRPVVVTFLSGHCSHSFDTLPVLAQLKKKYEPLGLSILPVYINSGSVDDVLTWSSEMELGFPLLVSNRKKLSEAYESRMVPATFLIDDEGKVRQKFVGYKSHRQLDIALGNLMRNDFSTKQL